MGSARAGPQFSMSHPNSFGSRATLAVGDRHYAYFRLAALDALPGSTAASLPFSLRVLLENLLRGEDGAFVKRADVESLAHWNVKATVDQEIQYLVAERNPFLRALGKAPEVMFSFLDMKDANNLKLICKQLREDVRNAFWSVHTDEMADD